mmetsp:Transcript_25728/g.56422  ORF Transcript_25728/g.56422 Transcript_25728/m.56422 type:complete len:640 (+) Transcript_25728:177-2096(+)|eukprot:CAMPEP_0168305268 /NCGR_PEP_ID=MMETSP0142_2-20121227/49570_1 /TAXON_ID=44445 /ORGANISM="Pseudo-nitzschia australis, Strain 10249 10 AB" /LENGTH=639 /DNA_ID=CAMNT_0008256705 /DNA_START=163 /DNA_END=2082 /DNA_ORIENTATION=-
MSSRGRSVTPGRRYGEIIGNIFSKGSGDEEEQSSASYSSEAKRMFRERRQNGSTGIFSRKSTPERRQTLSPLRRFNESRSNGRPPTPDRNHNRSLSPAPNGRLLSDQLDPFENVGKGISIRALSKSPSRRKTSEMDSLGPVSSYVTNKMLMETSDETREGPETAGTTSSGSVQQKTDYNNEADVEEKAAALIWALGELPVTTEEESKSSVSFSSNDSAQMKKIIQAQNEQIRFYESRLKYQSTDIEQLKFELQQTKRNESKLNLELDIHDLKYSMYDEYRRMIDRRRLDGKIDDEGDEIEGDLENSQFSKTCATFSKVDRLNQLYEKSRTEAENRYSILQAEYDKVKSRFSELEGDKSRPISNGSSTVSEVVRADQAGTSSLLEKRIKILESENLNYLDDIQRKQKELDEAKLRQSNAEKKKYEVETHNIETQTLSNKIVALETEIGFTSGNIDNRTRTSRYRALEKNLNEYVVEIMGLEDQLKSKEKVILKLKEKELTRMCESPYEPSAKWYNGFNRGGKALLGSKMSLMGAKKYNSNSASAPSIKYQEHAKNDRETIAETSKPLAGEKIEAVSAVSSYINKNVGVNKFDSRRIGNTRTGPTSTRIAMLRRRLDALASDHSSVCTEETLYSAKTTPYF